MPAALNSVRNARAVRPCLPMTLPTSDGATVSSRTVSCASSTWLTCTWSGASTSALTTCSSKARASPFCSLISGPHCVDLDGWQSRLSGRTGRYRGRLSHDLADPVRHLGALGNPVLDPVALQFDSCRAGARIVGPYYFNGTAVARALFLDHHHAIMRLFARTCARQTNHQHRT